MCDLKLLYYDFSFLWPAARFMGRVEGREGSAQTFLVRLVWVGGLVGGHLTDFLGCIFGKEEPRVRQDNFLEEVEEAGLSLS